MEKNVMYFLIGIILIFLILGSMYLIFNSKEQKQNINDSVNVQVNSSYNESNVINQSNQNNNTNIHNISQAKTCAQLGGNPCIISNCQGNIVNSSDNPNCCVGQCKDSSCSKDSDCNDNSPGTYDYCYTPTSKCIYISESSSSYNLDSSFNETKKFSMLLENCTNANIKKSNDSINNYTVRYCSASNVWGWCKDWITYCSTNGKREQTLIHKTPNQETYTKIGSSMLN